MIPGADAVQHMNIIQIVFFLCFVFEITTKKLNAFLFRIGYTNKMKMKMKKQRIIIIIIIIIINKK